MLTHKTLTATFATSALLVGTCVGTFGLVRGELVFDDWPDAGPLTAAELAPVWGDRDQPRLAIEKGANSPVEPSPGGSPPPDSTTPLSVADAGPGASAGAALADAGPGAPGGSGPAPAPFGGGPAAPPTGPTAPGRPGAGNPDGPTSPGPGGGNPSGPGPLTPPVNNPGFPLPPDDGEEPGRGTADDDDDWGLWDDDDHDGDDDDVNSRGHAGHDDDDDSDDRHGHGGEGGHDDAPEDGRHDDDAPDPPIAERRQSGSPSVVTHGDGPRKPAATPTAPAVQRKPAAPPAASQPPLPQLGRP